MKSTVFANISEQKKGELRQFFESWKRGGSRPDLLEEGLRYLSSDKREPATSLLAAESPIADICCAYGKGARARLSLSKKDASMLLRIVEKVRAAGADERTTSQMIGRAFDMMMGAQFPTNGKADDVSRRLMDALGDSAPAIRQGTLF